MATERMNKIEVPDRVRSKWYVEEVGLATFAC